MVDSCSTHGAVPMHPDPAVMLQAGRQAGGEEGGGESAAAPTSGGARPQWLWLWLWRCRWRSGWLAHLSPTNSMRRLRGVLGAGAPSVMKPPNRMGPADVPVFAGSATL